MSRNLLVTGGAGFIGSAFALLAKEKGDKVVVLDALTYAGNLANIEGLKDYKNYKFVHGNINDYELVKSVLNEHKIDAIIHFAAESHVDNSISSPKIFIDTNIYGSFNLLECAREYLKENSVNHFRFIHVSTDEVFGTLELDSKEMFKEDSPYKPNSPYSASKAASDLLAKAWYKTYKLPVIVTNCSNNYGPRQYPEKLIPFMVKQAITGKELTIYGNGKNIRDWIYVEDHAKGIYLALEKGKIGETYCFGGREERSNLDIVNLICEILDRLLPKDKSYKEQIVFIKDRPGHDLRYAIDDSYTRKELGFSNERPFEKTLEDTINWYVSYFKSIL